MQDIARGRIVWPLVGAAAVVLGLALGVAEALFGGHFLGRPKDSDQPAPRADDPLLSAPLHGGLEVRVWSAPGKCDKRGRVLGEAGSLPLRRGALVHLHARLNRKAHVYLLWLDGQGQVTPLYPWNRDAGVKDKPPLVEAVDDLHSPAQQDRGWPMSGPAGTDTILFLARETPLPDEVRLDRLIGAWPKLGRPDIPVCVEYGLKDGKEEQLAVTPRPRGFWKPPGEEAALGLVKRLAEHFQVVHLVQFDYEG
jgi:hypothetical protein